MTPDRLHSTPLDELLASGLGVVGLMADIPSSGGSFTVWPGTHRIICDLLLNSVGLMCAEVYKRRIIEFNAEPHVEGDGAADDVLLWHRLLAHTAGWNRSPRFQLREAPLCEIQKKDDASVGQPILRRNVAWLIAGGGFAPARLNLSANGPLRSRTSTSQ